MLHNVFGKLIYERRRSLVWWILGISILMVLLLAFYPSIRDSAAQLTQLMESMPKGMLAMLGVDNPADMVTAQGYLRGRVFSLMLPLLLMVFSIGIGARSLAGEEEARTIDMLLAHPIKRSTVVIQSLLAVAALTLLLGLVSFVAMWVLAGMVDLTVSFSQLFAASLYTTLMSLVFGMLAFLIGAATGKRGISVAIATVVGVVTYLMSSLASVVDWLKPFQKFSPFYYSSYNEPLKSGFAALPIIVLVSIIVVCAVASVFAFERRDVAV